MIRHFQNIKSLTVWHNEGFLFWKMRNVTPLTWVVTPLKFCMLHLFFLLEFLNNRSKLNKCSQYINNIELFTIYFYKIMFFFSLTRMCYPRIISFHHWYFNNIFYMFLGNCRDGINKCWASTKITQLVSDLTYRSQRYQRKQWREQQKRHREKIKNAPVILSPPHTPEPGPSHQQISSSKRRERSRAKCYRDNEKLKKELEIEKKKASKYMRRWLREVEKQKEKVETPRTKTKRILRGLQINMKTNEGKKRKQNV